MPDAGHGLDAPDGLGPGRPAHAEQSDEGGGERKLRTRPRTILCGSSGSLGHSPASDTAMNSPAKPRISQARGQICSNSRAHLLSRTLRSNTLSGSDRETLWRADICPLYHAGRRRSDTLPSLQRFSRPSFWRNGAAARRKNRHARPERGFEVPLSFLTLCGHIELDGPNGIVYLWDPDQRCPMPSVLSEDYLHDEAKAYALVESVLWPDGPVCPHCGVLDRSSPMNSVRER